MDWTTFGIAFGALAGGCLLRAIIPYLVVGLEAISEGGWQAWPKFEAKYVATFGTALLGYAIALLTIPGAIESLVAMTPIAAIALGYGGGDLVREGVKLLLGK